MRTSSLSTSSLEFPSASYPICQPVPDETTAASRIPSLKTASLLKVMAPAAISSSKRLNAFRLISNIVRKAERTLKLLISAVSHVFRIANVVSSSLSAIIIFISLILDSIRSARPFPTA